MPTWFTTNIADAAKIVGTARIETSRWPNCEVSLKINLFDTPTVGEVEPGTILPKRCAERHIQHDHTFCLGLSKTPVVDSVSAQKWWSNLENFLRLQVFAERTGMWPQQFSYDHGDAGEYQQIAESAATQLGILSEYQRTQLGETSWITDPDNNLMSPDGCPINVRRACPLKCRYKRRPNHIMIRRHCKNKDAMNALLINEKLRIKALNDFWEKEKIAGYSCCRSMKTCPLNC